VSDTVKSETELIQTYLAPLASDVPGAFGLADDAALLAGDAGTDFVVTGDPIISGVHFFPDDAPQDVAWKALAVNVSDLAAKGADPHAYMLALAFPEPPRHAWMKAFADGLRVAQQEFGCRLVGGDTDHTPGPLSIGVTAIGKVPKGRFVQRRGAKAGDHVFVTGTLGDAVLGLALRRDPHCFDGVLSDAEKAFLVDRYLRPQPRLALARAVRKHASAALDVSDGLMKDVARLSGALGVEMKFESVPLSLAGRAALKHDPHLADTIIGGGDDYELLVAVAPETVAAFVRDAAEAGIAVSDLGVLRTGVANAVIGPDGRRLGSNRTGYDHFAAGSH
jgi:thiamine-monophosphate kinase